MEEQAITIKKSEYERLKEENRILKRQLQDNTNNSTEFLGKKASEWLILKDLINQLLNYSGTTLKFEDLTAKGIKDKINFILDDTFKLKVMDKLLVDIENMMNQAKKELDDYNA